MKEGWQVTGSGGVKIVVGGEIASNVLSEEKRRMFTSRELRRPNPGLLYSFFCPDPTILVRARICIYRTVVMNLTIPLVQEAIAQREDQ